MTVKAISKKIIKTPRIILKHPRMTEKAALSSDKGVYVFDVNPGTNKNEIKKEIKKIYKVDAVKVNIINRKSRKVLKGGNIGKERAYKKALVYLKKGDKINVI